MLDYTQMLYVWVNQFCPSGWELRIRLLVFVRNNYTVPILVMLITNV